MLLEGVVLGSVLRLDQDVGFLRTKSGAEYLSSNESGGHHRALFRLLEQHRERLNQLQIAVAGHPGLLTGVFPLRICRLLEEPLVLSCPEAHWVAVVADRHPDFLAVRREEFAELLFRKMVDHLRQAPEHQIACVRRLLHIVLTGVIPLQRRFSWKRTQLVPHFAAEHGDCFQVRAILEHFGCQGVFLMQWEPIQSARDLALVRFSQALSDVEERFQGGQNNVLRLHFLMSDLPCRVLEDAAYGVAEVAGPNGGELMSTSNSAVHVPNLEEQLAHTGRSVLLYVLYGELFCRHCSSAPWPRLCFLFSSYETA
mmetsp:Transcript_29236/g.67848  ORF Transcript_29236/g.67848 Transcript_29236/m.67848 type:complete len:312 (-) Transcript_29236:103-1038(-)